nr:MAG TPA: hypothetical protein [Caudoviricetes sp.]
MRESVQRFLCKFHKNKIQHFAQNFIQKIRDFCTILLLTNTSKNVIMKWGALRKRVGSTNFG